MDLVPKPDQLVSAGNNLAHLVLSGGLADLRPMPRTLIDEGELREVYHYRPSTQAAERGDPVLLVTPLAAPALCYDLRRGCSLVEHLVAGGRPTYLVEYGEVSFRERALGMEHWVTGVVPAAIEAASAHAGGRPVHVVGWSLGGIFAMLTAADRPGLPIASITVLGSPVDVAQVPLVAPLRPLVDLTDGSVLGPVYRLLGGAQQPLVRAASQLSWIQKLVTKPVAVAIRLDDADFLAQLEAVDRFTAQMIAYPGRTFGQLYHRFVKGNALISGRIELDGHDIALADVTPPVLVVAGSTDGIAPVGSVRAVLSLLSGSREARFEIVPGGHLGLLTGRAARTSTWRVLDDWIDEWSLTPAPTAAATKSAGRRTDRTVAAVRKAQAAARDAADEPPAATTAATRKAAGKKAAGKKSASKQAASKKAAAEKSASKKAPAKKAASKATTKAAAKKATSKRATSKKTASKKTAGKKTTTATAADGIGISPRRRYGSSGSRNLAR